MGAIRLQRHDLRGSVQIVVLRCKLDDSVARLGYVVSQRLNICIRKRRAGATLACFYASVTTATWRSRAYNNTVVRVRTDALMW